ALAQTGAASALGRMLVRCALQRRVPMVHIVRRSAQVALLRSMGAEHVLDTSEPSFVEQLEGAFRKLRVTMVFDAVAGAGTEPIVRALLPGGRLVVYGGLSLEAARAHPADLIFAHKRVEGFWLQTWIEQKPRHKVLCASLAVQRGLR